MSVNLGLVPSLAVVKITDSHRVLHWILRVPHCTKCCWRKNCNGRSKRVRKTLFKTITAEEKGQNVSPGAKYRKSTGGYWWGVRGHPCLLSETVTASRQQVFLQLHQGALPKIELPFSHRKVLGVVFLDDCIPKRWLMKPWQRNSWIVKVAWGLKKDLHLKGAEKKFTGTSFLTEII